jgi:ACT domain-containing protein
MEAKQLGTDNAPTDIKSRKKSPREKQKFWADELKSSQKMLENWQKQGIKIVRRFVDDRGQNERVGIERMGDVFRLNLFHSNVKTLQDMMYGNLPTVEASRTFADAGDDVARVASEIMERLLNLDIQRNGQDYDSVLRSTLQDRLLPGLGVARVRYEVETEEVEIEAVADVFGNEIEAARTETQVTWEDAPVDYYHWQDVLWGWSRSFADIPWLAYRSYLSKDEIENRFGPKALKQVEFKTQKVDDSDNYSGDDNDDSPWMKAQVWEIWDKELRQVVWYSKGADALLDIRPDPLQLTNFFPSPPLLIANATTTLYKPTPDYHLSQDLYNEIDRLQTRIAIITEAVKVVGVYDAQNDGVQRMLNEGVENDLIPVDNWALFAESGGLKGVIDWFPIKDVVDTLNQLIAVRDQTIALLQQISGMSDIMRGGLQNQYEGVGQSEIKAQYGSIQVQSLQDQFAQFVGELMQLKAEVICRHFEPRTIALRSNMQHSMDKALVEPAMANLRLVIRPETMALIDYARLKAERTEFMNAFSTVLQSASGLLEKEPNSLPYVIKVIQWTMAGFKGSNEIEGVLDKAFDEAVQANQQRQDKPDPQQQAEQVKLQGELQKIQAKGQADQMLRQQDLQADMQTRAADHQAKGTEIMAGHQARMAEIRAKLIADMQKEQASMEANIAQTGAGAEAETRKDAIGAQIEVQTEAEKALIELDKEAEKTGLKIAEIGASSQAKIDEMIIGKAGETEDND